MKVFSITANNEVRVFTAALSAVQQTGERGELGAVNLPPLARASQRQLRIDSFPYFFGDNAFLLPWVDGSLVRDGTFVEDVRQQQPKRHPAEGSRDVLFSRFTRPGFGLKPSINELSRHGFQGPAFGGDNGSS
jgi:hypothetical protein